MQLGKRWDRDGTEQDRLGTKMSKDESAIGRGECREA